VLLAQAVSTAVSRPDQKRASRTSRKTRNGFLSNVPPAEGQQDWFSVAEHVFSPFFWCASVAGKLF